MMEVRRDTQTPRLCLLADGARGEGTPGPGDLRALWPSALWPLAPYAVDSAPAHFPFLPRAQGALQRALLAPARCGFPPSLSAALVWEPSQAQA